MNPDYLTESDAVDHRLSPKDGRPDGRLGGCEGDLQDVSGVLFHST